MSRIKSCPFCGAAGELKYECWIYANHDENCSLEKDEPVHIDIWNQRLGDDIIEWIVKNVSEDVVPGDEGNTEALVYNLVHLATYGSQFRRYNYESDQDLEIETLYKEFEREI